MFACGLYKELFLRGFLALDLALDIRKEDRMIMSFDCFEIGLFGVQASWRLPDWVFTGCFGTVYFVVLHSTFTIVIFTFFSSKYFYLTLNSKVNSCY
jgi:hypothetical protein